MDDELPLKYSYLLGMEEVKWTKGKKREKLVYIFDKDLDGRVWYLAWILRKPMIG